MKRKKEECNIIDIVRFIGIYLVVFAHFTLLYTYSFLSYMVYTFHMPLFFIISGILHKNKDTRIHSFLHIFHSLIIPFIIYNSMGYIYLSAKSNTYFPFDMESLYRYITVQDAISGATWFFIVLFGVKLISIFLHSKISYILTSIVCSIILILIKYNYNNTPSNFFLYQSVLMSFPYFTFGILIKEKLEINFKIWIRILWIVLSLPVMYIATTKLGSMSIGSATYYNLIINFLVAIIGSVTIYFFSSLIFKYVRCHFIKDISRGTMIIVGTHFFIIHQVFPDVFAGAKPITHVIFLSVFLFLMYYPIIKLTYNNIPILYGKSMHK